MLLNAYRLLLLALLLAFAGAHAEQALRFGVLNQQSPQLTAERWNPILQHVGALTGTPLVLRMGPTVQETNAAMARGEYDFAFTNHNFQSEFDHVGYRVIARLAGDPFRGVLAVAADSPLRTLADLQDKRVAFPSRDAFLAYAVPQLALRQHGVNVQEVLAGNQEGALSQLKLHRVDAAAVNSRALADYAARENLAVRVIFSSEAFPDLAVIVHPRVPATVAQRVRDALVGMRHDEGGRAILARSRFKGFEAATDKDYASVRRVYRESGQ